MQLLTSSVCIRFGLMASFINTVNAPLTPYLKPQMNSDTQHIIQFLKFVIIGKLHAT